MFSILILACKMHLCFKFKKFEHAIRKTIFQSDNITFDKISKMATALEVSKINSREFSKKSFAIKDINRT